MNYYQHHIGDFIRDTARLSDSQCMAYLRMLWMYYETEEPLDCDVDAIAFKLGANASDVQQILKHFFFEHDGKWHHARCDKEILAFRSKSASAKKSANARWSNANAMRTHSDRNAIEPVFDANQEPITNNVEANASTFGDKSQAEPEPKPEKKPKRATQLPDDFYPDETGQALARELGVGQGELAKFRDYHTARGTTMKDWQAAWRTWARNAAKFAARSNGHAPQANRTLDQKAIVANTFAEYGRLGDTNGNQQQAQTPALLGR